MTQRPHPRDAHPSLEADEPREQEPDRTSKEEASRREIIPGNVGSLDDVPADLVREADVVDDEDA